MKDMLINNFGNNVYFEATIDHLDNYCKFIDEIDIPEDFIDELHKNFRDSYKNSWLGARNEQKDNFVNAVDKSNYETSQLMIQPASDHNNSKIIENNMVVLGMVKRSPEKTRSPKKIKTKDSLCDCQWKRVIF